MPLKDPIKRKEYETKWRKEHQDFCRKWRRDWDKLHPEKKKNGDKKYRKSHPWIIHYNNAKQRCINVNHENFPSYGNKGILFQLLLSEIKELYIRDNADKMKRPSLDRIDTYGNYTFNNCRFIEFEENNKREKRKSPRIKILQFDKQGNFIKEWFGVREASIFTNQSISNIVRCLTENQKTAGGFIWKYKEII